MANSNSEILKENLTEIADLCREKLKISSPIHFRSLPFVVSSAIGGIPFLFGGVNAVKVSEFSETWKLSDTSFVVGSSISTSATSIKATVSNYYTNTSGSPTYAYGDKDIVVVQKCFSKPTHVGSSGKTELIETALVYVTWFTKRKTTDTSANTTRQALNASCTMMKYLNASGVVSRASSSYGFYMTPQTPSCTSNTSASTYVRVSSPVLYYRASSTYESQDNIKKVTDCGFQWTVEVYAVDKDSTVNRTVQDEVDKMLVNGWLIEPYASGGSSK